MTKTESFRADPEALALAIALVAVPNTTVLIARLMTDPRRIAPETLASAKATAEDVLAAWEHIAGQIARAGHK